MDQIVGVLDGRHGDEKLELLVRETAAGAVEIELRLLAWGKGIGWYPQRTLPLPADLVLLRALLRRAESLSRRGTRQDRGTRIVALPAHSPADQARPVSA